MRISPMLILSVLVCSSLASFTPSLALHLGYYAAAAYDPPASVASWTCSHCIKYPLTAVKTFSNTTGNIFGFTGYSSSLNAVIVTFRGSQDIKNWIINLDTGMTTYSKCSNCKVHAGFNAGFEQVKPTVYSQVQALKNTYRNAKVFVTGHSLGGALGILAAADLKDLYGVNEVYTFGQPRVGNAQFASWYTSSIGETYRLVHYADIVPHLPPSSFTFTHSSHQIWYDEAMATYKQCEGDSSGCANSIPATKLSTSDHDMENYLKLKGVITFGSLIKNLLVQYF